MSESAVILMTDPQKNMIPEFIQKMIDNSHDVFIISDSEMKIIFSNITATRIFGYGQKELAGKSIQMLMPENRRNNYLYDMESALKGSIVSNIDSGEELFGQRKNGEIFPIELTYLCYSGTGTKYFVSQIRDISVRKDNEDKLNVTSKALKVITESNRILIRSESEKQYLQGICNVISEIGGYSKSLILRLDETGDDMMLIPVAASGPEHFKPETISFSIASVKNSGSPTIISIKDKKTNVCRNIRERGLWKYWKDSPGEMDFDSTISVPILSKDKVTGILRVYSRDPFAFDENEIKLLEELAKDISHGIKVLRERIELETTLLTLKILTETNRLLANEQNEDGYLKKVCDLITGLGHFSKSMLLLTSKSGESETAVKIAAYSGYSEDSIKAHLSNISLTVGKCNPGSPTAIAINGKRIYVCGDIVGRGLWKYWVDSPEKMEFQSTIALPLAIREEIAGVLRVFSDDPFYFTQPRIELLDQLAKDISHGIQFFRTKAAHENAVKALVESEKKYRDLFQSNSDAVLISDVDTGIILDANIKAEEIFFLERDKIIGSHISSLDAMGYTKRLLNLLTSKFEEGKIYSDQFYLKTRPSCGKAVPIQLSASLFNLDGRNVIQCILRDISRLKKEEEEIRNIQKLEALGTLSGGIAHDINNILSPIIGFTQLALLETDNKEKQMSCLNEVITAANRAKDLAQQILTYCRKSETDKYPHRIHNVIKEVLKLITVSLPPVIKLETVIDENCEPIVCDPVQIYQVVINLCTNAIYAMKDKGGILKVCLVRKGSPEIKSDDLEKTDLKKYICIIVSDTGCGMSKTILNRVYEPYFTTKPKGEGTGLGLSVVLGIVKEHDGEIYTRTYPNEGTYFKISFPTVEKPVEEKHEQVKTANEGKKKNVLVIDDEPQITSMLLFMLNELGYSAEAFTDPVKAVNSFLSDPHKFDLILTDQSMPGMQGTELAEKALAARPDIPVILNTGYSPLVSKKEAKKMGIKQFIMKPVTISDLSVAISNSFKL